MKTPLEEYPKLRQWAYRAIWGVGVALGCIQAWCFATATTVPPWTVGALGVLAYVSIATNYVADRNVQPKVDDQGGGGGEGP